MGENSARATSEISSGLAGLPAANDPGAAPEDCVTAVLPWALPVWGSRLHSGNRGRSGLGLSFGRFTFATAAPGIGWLYCRTDSVCASAKAVSASPLARARSRAPGFASSRDRKMNPRKQRSARANKFSFAK